MKLPLRRNFQTLSTNRFVVDSPRFWRREFHPRFKDIFTVDEFKIVVDTIIKNIISYDFSEEYINTIPVKLYEWFSGYRFGMIPQKNPNATKMFLADLYHCLADILPSISFKDFQLIEDDFNLVTHKADTGKADTANVGTQENNRIGNRDETKLDILSDGLLQQRNSSDTQNIDEENWQNRFTVNDTFISPQNMGVKPTIENIDPTNPETPVNKRGISGIPQRDEANFTTTTDKENLGESNKSQSNTSAQGQESEKSLRQNSDVRTTQEKNGDIEMGQHQENTVVKTSGYQETLDFNRGARLQDFFDLVDVRLWDEILARLSRWILQADIATGERNYNDCPVWD